MTRPASGFAPTSLAVAGWRTLGGSLAAGIVGRKFMPVFAVRPSLLPNGVCKAADGKAGKVGLLVLGEDFAGLPAQGKASVDGIVMKPGFFGPLHSGLGHAFVGYANIAVSVIGLLLSRSPFAVIRSIALRIVDALNGKALWSLAHVFLERHKIIPARTNLYATPAISVIMLGIGVVTSGSHLQPYAINWGIRFTMLKPHIWDSLIEAPSILQRKGKVK